MVLILIWMKTVVIMWKIGYEDMIWKEGCKLNNIEVENPRNEPNDILLLAFAVL